jgi:dihydroorotate dehydrogenase electron transfer subunit
MQSLVIANTQLGPTYFCLKLLCPEIADLYQPGQFVMVRVWPGYDPLLPRPFAIHQTWQDQDQKGIDIIYQVVGRGTELMAGLKPGDQPYLLGPLGKGFTIPEGLRRALLVAGGIGISPLLALTHKLVRENSPPPKLSLLLGSRGKEGLLGVKEFIDLQVSVHIATEDGAVGHEGLVTDLMPHIIPKQRPQVIYASGPEAMLKEVGREAGQYEILCQVSLERLMACGVGACLSCVTKTRQPHLTQDLLCNGVSPSTFQYQRVCIDGPVFDAQEVIWNNGTE